MNQTLKKFLYPKTLIKKYKNWYLLLRRDQVTFGSLVLIEKSFKKKFSHLSQESLKELKIITNDIEKYFYKEYSISKINYLILMMVDPDVHFHIIPRHEKKIYFLDVVFKDFGYPSIPKLLKKNNISDKKFFLLKNKFKKDFKN